MSCIQTCTQDCNLHPTQIKAASFITGFSISLLVMGILGVYSVFPMSPSASYALIACGASAFVSFIVGTLVFKAIQAFEIC